jgi:hypothetical protein
VKCWGGNSAGTLGDGTTGDRSAPVDVVGLTSGVAAVRAGFDTTCALLTTGAVKCWGSGLFGLNGSTSDSSVPVDIPGLSSGVARITVASGHACAEMAAGGLKCWGSNFYGQFGDGTTETNLVLTPRDVSLPGLTSLSSLHIHECGLFANALKCWGDNTYGQLGDGTHTAHSAPVAVIAAATGLATGDFHTCALLSSGPVQCWGLNNQGQLGDGGNTDRSSPGSVTGLASGVRGIRSGQRHTCALMDDTTVKCWGKNSEGQLGNGSIAASQPFPSTVGTLQDQSITFVGIPPHAVTDAPFTVSATASSGLPIVFSSYTTSVCTVSGSTVSVSAIGICSLAADQTGNSEYRPARSNRSFLVSGLKPSSPTRLSNISTRMQVLTGEDVLIGGFAIQSGQKTVLIRARGPSLTASGVPNPLANPTLRLYRGSLLVNTNDDFGTGPYAELMGEIGFAPSDARESAILQLSLGAGLYTAVVSGFGNTTGVALMEIFEIDSEDAPIINLSTRGKVLTASEVMIGGFIIVGNSPQTVVVRARGPSLSANGIANPLADPTLDLVRSSDQMTIATNDNWQTASNAAQVSASGFAPSHSLESAILITLQPGAYTAIVRGVNDATGVGIVEVFAVQ